MFTAFAEVLVPNSRDSWWCSLRSRLVLVPKPRDEQSEASDYIWGKALQGTLKNRERSEHPPRVPRIRDEYSHERSEHHRDSDLSEEHSRES